jgi:hypothetical protein
MATTRVGELIATARRRRWLSFGDVSRHLLGAVSAKQISRLSLRLVRIEREGATERKLVRRTAVLLGLDLDLVDKLLDADRAEELRAWNERADEIVRPTLHAKAIPGFWVCLLVPENMITEDERIEYARDQSRRFEQLVLALSGRVSIVFSRGQLVDRLEAAPGRSIVPVLMIGKQLAEFETSA